MTLIIFIFTSRCKPFLIKLIIVLVFFINLSPSYIKLKRPWDAFSYTLTCGHCRKSCRVVMYKKTMKWNAFLKFDSDRSSHKPNTRGVIISWSGLLYFLVLLSHHTNIITKRRKCFPWKTFFLSLLFSQTYLPFYPSHLLSSTSFFLCLGTK